MVLVHPAAARQLADLSAIEFAARGVVDVFDAGVAEFELGFLEGAGQALILAVQPLGFDQQREAFIEAQRRHVGLPLLLLPRFEQAVES